MKQLGDDRARIAAIAVGAGVWLLIALIARKREAWDSALYFVAGLPLLFATTAVLGYRNPVKPWRWAAWLSLGQAGAAFLLRPGGSMMVMGLMMFVLFGLLFLLAAYGGALVRRSGTR